MKNKVVLKLAKMARPKIFKIPEGLKKWIEEKKGTVLALLILLAIGGAQPVSAATSVSTDGPIVNFQSDGPDYDLIIYNSATGAYVSALGLTTSGVNLDQSLSGCGFGFPNDQPLDFVTVLPSDSINCIDLPKTICDASPFEQDVFLEAATCGITIVEEPICGDGTIEAPEQCDDGNAISGDGCNDICQIENAESLIDEDQYNAILQAGWQAAGRLILGLLPIALILTVGLALLNFALDEIYIIFRSK